MQSALRLLAIVALGLCLSLRGNARAEDNPKPTASSSSVETPKEPVPSASATPMGATFEERLHNAETVKVATSVLGVELGSSLESAHRKLDALSDPATPPKEEGEEKEERGEGERKVLWRFAATDYTALFVKTGDDERITSVSAFFRPGKEQEFEKLGEVNKAPFRSSTEVAWDVVRPGRPLVRVVARGRDGKANTILMFIVKRGSHIEAQDH
jgi:hypothetical protein